jgi:uncharacterized protein involved in response to NO
MEQKVTTVTVNRRPAAVWSMGFRPFFLAAGFWAVLALAFWIFLFLTGSTLPSRFDPRAWHIHAMLFGFVLAAAAGFLLTAIPNWTGRRPIRGVPLMGLVLLWVLGRIASLASASLPLELAAIIDIAFPFTLAGVAAREVIAARNWRNLMMPLPIAVLGIADLLMYLDIAGYGVPVELGWRLAIAAVIIMISAVGGRIIPAFTFNWLARKGVNALPASHSTVDSAALALLHTSLLAWAFFPAWRPLGFFLLLAAALNFWRLTRWRGWTTLPEPLLAVLHLGYAWVVVGTALLGGSILYESVPESAAIHAFTAGAIGTMILAVMTRVTRGHTGRPLEADTVTTLIYGMILASGILRVLAAWMGGSFLILLSLSALFWIGSFGLFALFYGPMLVLPRADRERG